LRPNLELRNEREPKTKNIQFLLSAFAQPSLFFDLSLAAPPFGRSGSYA
jgi:hypothetical protein